MTPKKESPSSILLAGDHPNMAGFPPGITLIFANVPRMLLPIALTTSGIKLCKLLFGLSLPDWLYVPLSIASLPLSLACRLVYADLRNKHQAKLHAAVLAPSVTTKWPGGLDLLISILKNLREGYMGWWLSHERS